ncbi:MAG: ArsR family transcriptional regulator [Candidatus Bipolaricaulia bacterium]
MAKRELLAELEEITKIGRQLRRFEEAEDLEQRKESRAWEYLRQGLLYLEAAFEEFVKDTPSAVIDAWAEEFRKELRSETDPAEEGKASAPSIIALSPATSAKVLTPGRLNLLSILAEGPVESVSQLAQRAEKPIEVVSRDLKVLGNFGFIEFEREGKRKKPILLNEHILILLKDRHPKSKKKRNRGG